METGNSNFLDITFELTQFHCSQDNRRYILMVLFVIRYQNEQWVCRPVQKGISGFLYF